MPESVDDVGERPAILVAKYSCRDEEGAGNECEETPDQDLALRVALLDDVQVALVAEAHARVLGLPSHTGEVDAHKLFEELAESVPPREN